MCSSDLKEIFVITRTISPLVEDVSDLSLCVTVGCFDCMTVLGCEYHQSDSGSAIVGNIATRIRRDMDGGKVSFLFVQPQTANYFIGHAIGRDLTGAILGGTGNIGLGIDPVTVIAIGIQICSPLGEATEGIVEDSRTFSWLSATQLDPTVF